MDIKSSSLCSVRNLALPKQGDSYSFLKHCCDTNASKFVPSLSDTSKFNPAEIAPF